MTKNKFSIEMRVVLGFALYILLGAGLLTLPIMTQSGAGTPFIDALFTATSASCVTGLTVVTTSAHWNTLGQIVIIALIQVGGLGLMTFGTLFALLVRKRIGLRDRQILSGEHGYDRLQGIVRILKYILGFTFATEGLGALLLATQFIPYYGLGRGLWFSIFHAISAFCNAGFDLVGDSLYPFRSNLIVNFAIMALVVIGGLGFLVNQEILYWRRRRRLSSQTKLVLMITALLLFGGAFIFWLLERSNPLTMGQESLGTQGLQALFQSVIARTAGFYTLDFTKIRETSAFWFLMLMFIGASPGSTGGGLKTTTFGVLLASTYHTIRGNKETVFYKRRVPRETIAKAYALMVLSLSLVLVVTFILTTIEKFSFLPILFETVSAFATVGNTLGITPGLTAVSKFLLSLTMYIGRIGPLTLAYALNHQQNKHTKYAKATLFIG